MFVDTLVYPPFPDAELQMKVVSARACVAFHGSFHEQVVQKYHVHLARHAGHADMANLTTGSNLARVFCHTAQDTR